MQQTAASVVQAGRGIEGVAGGNGVVQKKPDNRTVQATASPSAVERPLRPQLAKTLLEFLAQYAVSANPTEHFAHPPELPHALVSDAVKARASDIHIEPFGDGVRIRFRIDGLLADVANVSAEQGKWLLNQFKAVVNLDPIVRFTPKNSHGHISLHGGTMDIRLALAPTQKGEIMSIRLLDPKRLDRSLSDLGFTPARLEQIESWVENVNGLFLCAGPTGSGKTTTVYALLHQLKFADRAIVSIEDPVEYEVSGINQVQLDERHHLSFAEGVKAMLRLDPDFLMIGEIRDAASAHAAVDAAITGRVLLSTVHARDAVATVTALRNWGLPDHEIAESLSVVIAQRLVRCLCPECKVSGLVRDNERRWLETFCLDAPKKVWLPKGCAKCNGLGYFGRTGIFELWQLTESDYELILDDTDEHRLRAHFREAEQETLLRDGLRKVISGTTSIEELRRANGGAFPCERLDNHGSRKEKITV